MADWYQGIPTSNAVTAISRFVGYVPPNVAGMEQYWTGQQVYDFIELELADNNLTLPAQTGNSGKFLTTNGAVASWASSLPAQTGHAGEFLTTDGTNASWASVGTGPVSTGNNAVTIPRLQSDPDQLTAGRDEFNDNAAGTPTGWTDISSGAPDSINTNGFYSMLFMQLNGGGGGGTRLKGIYRNLTSVPCTITMKLQDASLAVISDQGCAGVAIIAAGSTGNFEGICANSESVTTIANSYRVFVKNYNNRTSGTGNQFSSTATMSARPPVYFRIIVNSQTDVDYQYSYDGKAWNEVVTARNPGFTIAAVAIYGNAGNSSQNVQMYVDWIEVTYP